MRKVNRAGLMLMAGLTGCGIKQAAVADHHSFIEQTAPLIKNGEGNIPVIDSFERVPALEDGAEYGRAIGAVPVPELIQEDGTLHIWVLKQRVPLTNHECDEKDGALAMDVTDDLGVSDTVIDAWIRAQNPRHFKDMGLPEAPTVDDIRARLDSTKGLTTYCPNQTLITASGDHEPVAGVVTEYVDGDEDTGIVLSGHLSEATPLEVQSNALVMRLLATDKADASGMHVRNVGYNVMEDTLDDLPKSITYWPEQLAAAHMRYEMGLGLPEPFVDHESIPTYSVALDAPEVVKWAGPSGGFEVVESKNRINPAFGDALTMDDFAEYARWCHAEGRAAEPYCISTWVNAHVAVDHPLHPDPESGTPAWWVYKPFEDEVYLAIPGQLGEPGTESHPIVVKNNPFEEAPEEEEEVLEAPTPPASRGTITSGMGAEVEGGVVFDDEEEDWGDDEWEEDGYEIDLETVVEEEDLMVPEWKEELDEHATVTVEYNENQWTFTYTADGATGVHYLYLSAINDSENYLTNHEDYLALGELLNSTLSEEGDVRMLFPSAQDELKTFCQMNFETDQFCVNSAGYLWTVDVLVGTGSSGDFHRVFEAKSAELAALPEGEGHMAMPVYRWERD